MHTARDPLKTASYARGLACLLLVIYHVVGATAAQGLQVSDGPLRFLNDSLASVRMPLFGLIAGAVYHLNRYQGWNLLRHKWLRLIVPMLLVGTLFALVQTLAPDAHAAPINWWQLHLIPVAHYWFLESLFMIFVLMTGLQKLRQWTTLAGWTVVFSLSLLLYLSHWGTPWFGLAGAGYLLPFFLWGLGITRFATLATIVQSRRLWWALALSALLLWAGAAQYGALADRRNAVMLVLGLLGATALWLRPPTWPLFDWLGKNSYVIFLFHVFFTASTRMALHRLHLDNLPLNLIAGVFMGIAGPALLSLQLGHQPRLRHVLLGQ